MPKGAAEAVALWVLHAHAHDASEVSPILAITSPEKRSGKTTLLELIQEIVPRPFPASNVSTAAVFRSVEKWRPTLLIDEADTFLNDREDLRGVLNSGHRHSMAFVIRTVGEDHEPRSFETWAPKAIAKIGSLPDTLHDRSIVIPMRRKRTDESKRRLRRDRLASECSGPLRQAATWAEQQQEDLRQRDPMLPEQLHDRARDNWRPLIAIADSLGGDWPQRARTAALGLSGIVAPEEESIRVQLLEALRRVFTDSDADKLPSRDIVEQLVLMEDGPWAEYRRGKPITPAQVARLLRPHGVRPKDIWIADGHGGGRTLKGYELAALQDAFGRYLPPADAQEPQESVAGGAYGDETHREDESFIAGNGQGEFPDLEGGLAALAAREAAEDKTETSEQDKCERFTDQPPIPPKSPDHPYPGGLA